MTEDLYARIRRAQIAAAERVVVEDLGTKEGRDRVVPLRLDEPTERLLHLLKDRGRLRPFAPWHLVAYEKAAALGLAQLQLGAVVLTEAGRRRAKRLFGGPVSGPEGPSALYPK